jgi:DNA polymerase
MRPRKRYGSRLRGATWGFDQSAAFFILGATQMTDLPLFLDFETRSVCDLVASGVHKYAEDPTTGILCTAFAFGDAEPTVVRGMNLPREVKAHCNNAGLVVAHNAPFEYCMWNGSGVRVYDVSPLYPSQMQCTMSEAYALSLPGSLEAGAAAVGITAQKDMAGHRLMLKMCKPRSIDPITGEITWWEDEADIIRLMAYCAQDLRVTQQYRKRLLRLSPTERRVWELDQEINNRGIAVDLSAAILGNQLVQDEQVRLNAEIRVVTKNEVPTYNSHVSLKKWLACNGIATEGVAKDAVATMLSLPYLSPRVRRALEIRQEASKSSTAKLDAFIARACADQRLKGLFQYHAAGTGRWAGRGVQPQNFPRPTIKQKEIEQIFTRLHDAEELEMMHGSIINALSNALRGFLIAPRGKDLMAADWSAIEARGVAWLAGQEDKLELFRSGGKVYETSAGETYGAPPETITKDDPRRQIGKVSILSLGYQGGVNAFQQMAKGYNVRITKEIAVDIWRRAPEARRAKARWGWDQRGKKSGIPNFEWLGCELIKLAFREANPAIVQYWGDIEKAAISAVQNPGQVFRVRNVAYRVKGSFLFCRLPSGRCLSYPYPEIGPVKTPWDETKPMLKYKGVDSTTKKWVRQTAYGGMLVENITQAVCRDIMAYAMLRCPHPIVLHVHDEIVTEIDEDLPAGALKEFEKLCSEVPEWAEGFPLTAEGWRGKRFRK